MKGLCEVLEIIGVLLFWFFLSVWVAPRVKGGFS